MTTIVKRDQSYTYKHTVKFIEHLEEQLKSNDAKVVSQAQSDLKEVLLTQARLRDREASRRLKRDLGVSRKASDEDEKEILKILGEPPKEEKDFFD